MVFSSLLFVFLFLPLCYGLYILMPNRRAENVLLLVFSLIFYAWAGPIYLLLLASMVAICYGGALMIEKSRAHAKDSKMFLGVTVGGCLALLAFFKYTDFLVGTFFDIFGISAELPGIVLPIGISFYTFQLISYVVDVYRGGVPAQRNYFRLLLYAALFHQCIAGPIVRYADVENELTNRKTNLDSIWKGLMRFAVGLAKKAVLANACATIADTLIPAQNPDVALLTPFGVLFGMLAYAMQVFLDFSAYSDMAIGMGLMIGFHFKENFDYPYTATSVSEFWRRWHISLSSFFRDYVYFPLGGSRCSEWRGMLNLAIVWGLTGLWHGASWNYVLWGVYFGVLIILEKYVFKFSRTVTGIKAVLRRVYTVAAVFVSWFLFRFETLGDGVRAFGALFGIGTAGGYSDIATDTLVGNNLFIFIVCVLACTPIVPALGRLLDRACASGSRAVSKVGTALRNANAVAVPVCLIILSAVALAGANYNPFLYFRF